MRHTLWLLTLLCLAAPALAQEPAAPDSSESYWGPLPADDASSRVTYAKASTHPVEHALLTPFYLVTYPVFLTTRVLKAGIQFADEHGVVPGFGPSLPIHIGNVSMGPLVTAGGHSGFGGGATILYEGGADKRSNLILRYVSTVKGMHRGSVGFRAPWGTRNALEIGGGYRLERNARFFGTGPSSDEADLAFFTQEQSWGGVGVRRRHGSRLTSEWKAIYTSIETRAPRDEDTPGVAQQFAGDLPVGYGERSRGILYSGLLRYDTTRGTGRPEPGMVARGEADYFGPTGGDPGAFWRYTGEA
ncbi:MAG TPA: hypothetical protein VN539_07815, partial [Candidatus Saccharimonadales bacterium]|nr:hypothetical protein [Candidatus Saccharimonadales bacterium]